MKQGLSLGFAQSLSLTPQLQQSIRLLQLSSLELEQEIEQQLATNPFLERDSDMSEREHFDPAGTSSPASELPRERESAADASDEGDGDFGSEDKEGEVSNWDGDGSTETAPDDDAP